MNKAPVNPYANHGPFVKVPTSQTTGTIIAKIFNFIFAFTMGFSIPQIYFNWEITYVATFWGLMAVGSAFSVGYMSYAVKVPENLAGNKSRLGMLFLTAGSLIKFAAVYLSFAGFIMVVDSILYSLIAIEIIVNIYVFLFFYADESQKDSFLVSLKPSVIKEQLAAPVYPAYGYPMGAYGYPVGNNGVYPQPHPQMKAAHPQQQQQPHPHQQNPQQFNYKAHP